MSGIAAIGEEARLAGYALAGAAVHPASDADQVRSAWARLPDDVALLVLTDASRAALGTLLGERPRLLWAVIPD